MKGNNQYQFSMTNPSRRYGHQLERETPLSPSKHFNQILFQKFAADSEYLCFPHSVLQKVQLSSQRSIAMKKVISNNLTAGING